VVKGVEQAFMGPWVCSRVEPLVAEMAGVDVADERKGAVELGVPGEGASGDEGGGGEGRAGVHDGLEGPVTANSREERNGTYLERGGGVRRGEANLEDGAR
jgi:hypothetical protein